MKRAITTLLTVLALVGFIGLTGSWAATSKSVRSTDKKLACNYTPPCHGAYSYAPTTPAPMGATGY